MDSDMLIEREGCNGTTLVPIRSVLFSRRIIVIQGEINEQLVQDTIRQIIFLNFEDDTAEIKILIDSVGGQIQEGMALVDCFMTSKAPITVIVTSVAYSMACLLTVVAKRRYCLPSAKLMIHSPLISACSNVNTVEISRLSEDMNATKKKIDEIIASHTGQTLKKVAELTSKDTYFTASEALENGFVDKIIELNDIIGRKEGA